MFLSPSLTQFQPQSLTSFVHVLIFYSFFVFQDAIGPGRALLVAIWLQLVGGVSPIAFATVMPFATAMPFAVIFARIIVGTGIVICYQAGNTWLAEWSPTEVRSRYMSLLHVTVSLGGIFCTTVAAVVPPQQWQVLLIINVIPTLLAIILLTRFVCNFESPRWLLVVAGQETECLRVLHKVREATSKLNASIPAMPNRLRVSIESEPDLIQYEQPLRSNEDSASMTEQTCMMHDVILNVETTIKVDDNVEVNVTKTMRQSNNGHQKFAKQLCHKSLCRLHIGGTIVAFCLNFGQKGVETWAGVYVENLGLSELSRSIYFMSLLGKVIGDLINIRSSACLGRLRMLKCAFWVAAVAQGTFAMSEHPIPLLISSFISGAASDILWCNVYIYLTEAFPTSVRSTAFGLAMGIGRSGGVLSSSIGNLFTSMYTAFMLYSISFIVGAMAVTLFTVETSHRALTDMV